MFNYSYRWKILLWLFVIVLIAYFDRVNFAIAAPIIMKEFGLNPAQLGMILSGFFIGYTMLNFPGGFIAEKFSSRTTATIILLLWSVMTIFTGFAWGFVSLMFIRILFGAFEGPLGPTVNKMVNLWMLPTEKATASALWLSAVPIGVVAGNIISGYVVTLFGWKSVFYIFGATGLVISFFTWKILRDSPAEHSAVSPKELELIKSSYVTLQLQSTGSSISQLLRNPWVWVLSFIYFTYAACFFANLNWLPTYFVRARGSSILKSGLLSSLPWMASLVGLFIMGWLSDNVGKRMRCNWMAAGLFIIAPFIVYAVITQSIVTCIICFCVALFFNMGVLSLMWSVQMDIFDRSDVAKVGGIVLSFGSLAGIIAPYLVGFVLQQTKSFNAAYYIFAIMSLIGGCFALILYKRENDVRKAGNAGKTISV